MMNMKAVTPRVYAATDNGLRDGKPVFLAPAQWKDKLVEDDAERARRPDAAEPGRRQRGDVQEGMAALHRHPAKTLNVYILCDPANSKKKDSDRTAMAVIGDRRGAQQDPARRLRPQDEPRRALDRT
jgi:hypothetical protein